LIFELNMGLRILLIEDDRREASSLERLLQTEAYAVAVEHRGDDGLRRAQAEDFDVVITDLRMPGLDGLEIIRQMHAAKPRLPIVLMTAYGTTDSTIEATRHGAFEYLSKPFKMDEFLTITAKAVSSARLMRDPVKLGEPSPGADALIGSSRVMETVYKEIGRVSATSVTVLIRGETGTGKELVARAIYQHSNRADKPFIAVNCAAIPETLLESELFGHEKGAFTGAESRRIGRFEQAHGGTLFLDEIGELPLEIQPKLLRLLQEKEYERVGEAKTRRAKVRVISATNRNLEKAVQEGRFREDLYYRLNVISIQMPPLRERLGDLQNIAGNYLQFFAAQCGKRLRGFSKEAEQAVRRYSWPGNLRELRNVVERAVILAGSTEIELPALPENFSQTLSSAEAQGIQVGAKVSLEELENEHIARVIQQAATMEEAAKLLGIDPATLYRKRKKLSL
jgi:DNA-binding NtrC family response regulator